MPFRVSCRRKNYGRGHENIHCMRLSKFSVTAPPPFKNGGWGRGRRIPLGGLLGRGCENYGHRRENTRRRGKTRSVLRRRFTAFPECPPGAGAKIILTLVLFFP